MDYKCRVCISPSLQFKKTITDEFLNEDTDLHKCFKCKSYFSRLDFLYQSSKDFTKGGINGHLKNEHFNKNRVSNIFNYLIKKDLILEKKFRFLDIGCGVGWSMITAKRFGADAYGIEPSKNATDYAKNELNLNVENSLFDPSKFEKDFFDVVMLDQVLEHVPNPSEMLNDIFLTLKPGGILFLSVPPMDWSRVISSISYQLPYDLMKYLRASSRFKKIIEVARRYDRFAGPIEHINFFSPKSISILTKNLNCNIIGQYHESKTRRKYMNLISLTTGSYIIKKSNS